MPKRVLVAEDNFVLANVLRAALHAAGYDIVAVVATGEEAVRLVIGEEPDIVVLDVSLAGKMTGIEAAERLRRSCACPVVFHTAHADAERRARMQAVARCEIVHKPGDVSLLVAAMRRLESSDDGPLAS